MLKVQFLQQTRDINAIKVWSFHLFEEISLPESKEHSWNVSYFWPRCKLTNIIVLTGHTYAVMWQHSWSSKYNHWITARCHQEPKNGNKHCLVITQHCMRWGLFCIKFKNFLSILIEQQSQCHNTQQTFKMCNECNTHLVWKWGMTWEHLSNLAKSLQLCVSGERWMQFRIYYILYHLMSTKALPALL